MNQTQIQTLVNKQRDFFYTGKTLDISYRIQALQKLKACISQNEKAISQAIISDLGKSSFESYMCETGLVLSEISYMLKHIRSLSREKRVHTPLAQFHSRSYTKPSPYGVVSSDEPLELSIPAFYRSFSRCNCSGKYGYLKAKCLLSCHQCPD